ncbi:MAG: metal ABC transporter ATP-binding protein [Polyangiaceae bacterium]
MSFGRTAVLRDLSFQLDRGSVLAVIGPNGAGKTVLFKALVGMLPHAGLVRWSPGTRIGYVPQKLGVERDLPLTSLDLLKAKADVVGAPAGAIEPVLSMVGLGEAQAKQAIGDLSGGQFQRLLLAAALIGDPTVLLLDEVTSGVDEAGQERAFALLDRLVEQRRRTVLLISHELSVVYAHATHVLCLARARAWFGPPTEVLTPGILRELFGPIALHVHDAPRS